MILVRTSIRLGLVSDTNFILFLQPFGIIGQCTMLLRGILRAKAHDLAIASSVLVRGLFLILRVLEDERPSSVMHKLAVTVGR
jgi:hypothetical protein